jgi:multidrug resistance efflux pump
MNDNLELQVNQFLKQIETLQEQLQEATSQSSSQTVTPQYVSAKSFYTSMNTPSPSSKTAGTGSGTYTASATSSTASASSGTSTASASSNIQEHQDQQTSANEEELKNAKIDRDNAETENYHLTNTVRYFMQTNNNHRMILMKLVYHTRKED